MADKSKQERIRELEGELAELKGGETKPLTLAEIRAMSREEVERRWDEVKAGLAGAPDQETTPAAPAAPAGLGTLASARRKDGYPDE